MRKKINRCSWCNSNPLMIEYHDNEWGVPVHDDRKHFEFILLDGFQAGLSWNTIVNKRDNFRKSFDDFDYEKIAGYNSKKIDRLMNDAGIIRNKLKINSAVRNAKAFMKIQDEFGSFDEYIWKFTDGRTIHNKHKDLKSIPATSNESDAMSKDLRKRGFNFAGSTICYAYMQAAGMVNDHVVSCFRYKEVKNIKRKLM